MRTAGSQRTHSGEVGSGARGDAAAGEPVAWPARQERCVDVSGEWTMVAHMAVAALLGGLIGIEREYRGYPAGVRTLALVCLGSALFTEMSWTFGPDADASRVAAGIVAGIGFLGAGVIVREGFTVKGITTAATIWTAAAIGVAVAQDYFVVATFVSMLIVLLLELNPLTKQLFAAGRRGRGGVDEEISE